MKETKQNKSKYLKCELISIPKEK